jgi:xanthine dehydrogenase YagT iron-sulfur-binding subunit
MNADVTLLDALLDEGAVTDTKQGCGEDACGACTVLLNGKCVLACLVLAAQYDERDVTTIERLATVGRLHPVEEASIRHAAVQGGYCAPRELMSAVALLQNGRAASDY